MSTFLAVTVFMNKPCKCFLYRVLDFNVNVNVQFWFESQLGFVDIQCFYFWKEKESHVTLSALLCYIHRKKINKIKVIKIKVGRAVAFLNQLYVYVHLKRVFRLHYSCLVIFILFVNFDFKTSLFFHRENGTQYIYSAEFSMDTWLFQVSVCVCVCVWAMLWSC